MTHTRIHVLCDNNARDPRFGHEHGLSLCLDMADGFRWLWDTGQTGLFLDNARTMGVEVESLRGLSLSHGHYDHTGGLASLLRAGFRGPIMGHSNIAARRWKGGPQDVPTYIGLDQSGLPSPVPEMVPVNHRQTVHAGLDMITDIPRRPGLCQSVDGFFLDPGLTRPDTLPDDACLVVDSEAGPVVMLGCCHSGLANTLRQVMDVMDLDGLYAVAGGFHLHNTRPDAVDEAVDTLREFSVQRVMPCHCTSPDAVRRMADALPGRVEPIAAGDVIEF